MRIARCRFVLLAILASAAASAAAPSQVSAENYALLVAVQEYDEKELRPLQFTRADILDFQKTLVESGFKPRNVIVLHDDLAKLVAHYQALGRDFNAKDYLPESAKIRKQLELVLGLLQKDDSLVVAFTGHGVQFAKENKSYFCPSDAKLDDKETLISLDEIYAHLKDCEASRKLLLVDACQNDPQSRIGKARRTVDLESVTRPQGEPVPEGIIALFSCRAGQQSFEHPPLGHGIFFHHVLDGWKGKADLNGDLQLSYLELAQYAEKQTAEYAYLKLKVSQKPQLKAEFSGEWVLRQLPAPKLPVKTAIVDVSGRFHSPTYGWLVLTQRGAQVTGETTYPNGNKGTMTGTVSGRTMDLRWSNGADSGTATLTLSADAKQLNGNWVGRTSRDDWTLIRK